MLFQLFLDRQSSTGRPFDRTLTTSDRRSPGYKTESSVGVVGPTRKKKRKKKKKKEIKYSISRQGRAGIPRVRPVIETSSRARANLWEMG